MLLHFSERVNLDSCRVPVKKFRVQNNEPLDWEFLQIEVQSWKLLKVEMILFLLGRSFNEDAKNFDLFFF